jgi:2,3-bisphosphoglycerate-dependent phosphoglycerate mutase
LRAKEALGWVNGGTLLLVRHGESEWDAFNLFAGWVDIGLTDNGRAPAMRAGELIMEFGLHQTGRTRRY